MATQSEMRKWLTDNGISCNPRGSLPREEEDIYLVGTSGYGVPVSELRGFVIRCRAWVKENEFSLTEKDRLTMEDLTPYVEWLTGQTEAKKMADAVAGLTVEAEEVKEVGIVVKEEAVQAPVDKPSPMARVRRQERQGWEYALAMALHEAQRLIGDLNADDPEGTERTLEEVRRLSDYAGQTAMALSTEYHYVYCDGKERCSYNTDQVPQAHEDRRSRY